MKKSTLISAIAAAIIVLCCFTSNSFSQAGNALDFDGTNDYADGSGISTSLTNITLEAWVYHRTLPASTQRYVTVGDEVAVIRHDGASQQGQLHFCIKTNGSLHGISVNNALQTGQWYHVAGTWDGTDMKLYLNGEEVGTSTPGGVLNAPDDSVMVSKDTEPMDGYIDEVRIWNDARTAEEIRSNMYKTLTGTESGLENYWMFNESSGPTAYDSAGTVNLTLQNMDDGDWVTSGAFTGPRNALEFDGVDDYVIIPNESAFDFTGAMTVEAWIKVDAFTTAWQAIVTKGDGAWRLHRYNETDHISFGTNGLSNVDLEGATNVNDGQWHHVAGVFDGSMKYLYVDGVEDAFINVTGSIQTTNDPVNIAENSQATGRYFDGLIDEVRIWNTARSQSEISFNMNTVLEGNESGLIACYRFDQEEEITLYDQTSNGNDGTLTNMADEDWVTSTAFNTWIGCAGTDWATDANWSQGTSPDTDSVNVGIPDYTGGNQPMMDGNFTCNNLTIDTGSDLTINSGRILTVNGNAFCSGSQSGAGIIELAGALASHTIAGTFNNIELDESNGAEMEGNTTINGTLTLTNGVLSIGANTLFLNGAISTTSGSLTGGPSSNITFGGSGASTDLPAISLGKLTINRANGIGLTGDVTIDDTLKLTNGDLNLNGDTLTLGNNATLSESVGNTVKGDSGIIITTRTFNAGDLSGGINIAGLGAEITTDAGLGETTIIRGHAAQIRDSIEGILRYYDIDPANNSGLNGTLIFHYDDTELNSITAESQLELFRSTDTGNTWSVEGGAVNTANNTIMLSGIDAFSRWTSFTTGFTKSVSLTGVMYSSVAWGDYDNDGDLDILLTGYDHNGHISRVYRNDGSGTFTDINAGLTGVFGGSVAWGDYDNDGDLDILLTGCGISRVYLNDGSGAFTDINAGLTSVYCSSVAWGDYDNDGNLDILLTGKKNDNTPISRVYRNDGSGAFTDINAGLSGVYFSSVAWGDYDNDGDLDILLTGNIDGNDGISRVYRNDGSGAFIDINAGLTDVQQSSVAWGDYDNDGDLDILLTGYIVGNDRISRVYLNDGSGAFTDINAGLPGVYKSSVAWGDYDNDGDLDILLTGLSSSGITSRVYRNDGSGTFTDINAGLPGVYFSSVAWGDYDNDGDLDILLTGYDGNVRISYIYRNDILVANTPPGTPGNLSASVSGQNVSLDWDKATDNETAQDALTYNIRIGALPGGVQTVSPMADVSNGYRKVVALGNTNHINSWEIKSLSGGTYYWSVQAVDNAFAGSAFATEGSFCLIGITTANITDITDTTANCGGNAVSDCNYSITAKGIVWDTLQNPTVETNIGMTNDGSGLGSFTSSLTGLSGGQTYNIRAYAINSEDTAYGGNECFTTTMSSGGNMLDFDGIDDHVEVPWSVSLNPIQFTIELWVMVGWGQGTLRSPVTSRDTDPSGGYMIYAGDDDKWQFWTGDGAGSTWDNKLVGNSNIVLDTWTHIAGTYDGSEMKLYINGYLDSTLSSVTFAANDSEPLRIGAGKTEAAADYHFPGKIDELRIWNTARSQDEIRENMHRKLTGDEDSLVAFYRFDHISGTFLYDHTANVNHGALQNMENQDWLSSTAPIPYFTVTNGNWEADSVWAFGQNAPEHSWARARIEHNITINSTFEVIELNIDASGTLTITTGYQLTVSGGE